VEISLVLDLAPDSTRDKSSILIVILLLSGVVRGAGCGDLPGAGPGTRLHQGQEQSDQVPQQLQAIVMFLPLFTPDIIIETNRRSQSVPVRQLRVDPCKLLVRGSGHDIICHESRPDTDALF
jgi:hypothetical protein